MKPFCPNCGIKDTKQDFEKKRLEVMGRLCGVVFFACDICGLMVDLVIQQEPKKTEEEAEVAFNQIPLTDNQRGVKKRKK
jgi:hypothetical protein